MVMALYLPDQDKKHHEKFCVFVVTDVWLVKLCCCFSVANRNSSQTNEITGDSIQCTPARCRYLFAAQSCALRVTYAGRRLTTSSKTKFSFVHVECTSLVVNVSLQASTIRAHIQVNAHTVRKCIAIDFPHRSCALKSQGIPFDDLNRKSSVKLRTLAN